MRTSLPDGHSLPSVVAGSALLHRNSAGEIELTDIQHDALGAGVARGTSILAVAPTSCGKTDIGLFAASSWLANRLSDGGRVVYLSSHRALARQKFREVHTKLGPLFSLAKSEIVLATGDDVIDASGDPSSTAFSAPIVVATYEKYLAMLAGAGLAGGLARVCCIADEIQLVGDPMRGESVEILLTLLRKQVGQLVGLSAVLEESYAQALAD